MENPPRPLRRSRAANTVIRRQQLIDATIESVSLVGFSETTLAKVASIAGLSQGVVVFRFGTKEQLLIETLKFLADEYKEAWSTALGESGSDPVNRLCAIVAADFHPKLVNKKKLSVWHSFYGEAKAHPIYMDICETRDQEHEAVLHQVLGEVAAAEGCRKFDTALAAAVIEGLSDGLWLQMLMSRPDYDRNAALDVMFHQLQGLLPDHLEQIARYRQDNTKPPTKVGRRKRIA